ncbi:phage portal protein [Gemmata sp. G18]|uniref:Phage portal protein n=1 Tax=Gemmata palustris TaxID=2822762 RepID=A0ABS5BVI1_9BACT|nr:phage portal protein [Gemmata palustris]MBP3957417.1 phage portal protein [Gemmata palustris]
MFQFARRLFNRTKWYPLNSLPEGWFFGRSGNRSPVATPDEALTLSPVFAALRWYQTTLSSLPLVVYRDDFNGGREQARTHPAWKLLQFRPNPAQTRNTFLQVLARDLFLHGEAFCQLRWTGTGALYGVYPIKPSCVTEVIVDDEWNKAFAVRADNGEPEVYSDTDMLHIVAIPDCDGIRGASFLRWAGEALGLHKQVQESATSFYKNAAKPSGYLRYAGKITPETINTIRENFKKQFAGTLNTGEIPLLSEGGEFTPLSGSNAEDAQIIEALGASVGDVSRWTGISSIILGDYAAAKYASLAAENQAVYQKSLRWMLEAIETEVNNKIFGVGSDFFAEFDTRELLRGDPVTQSQIDNTYLTSGVLLRNEVREGLKLNSIEGLDQPLAPLNQGAGTLPPVSPNQLPPAPGAA